MDYSNNWNNYNNDDDNDDEEDDNDNYRDSGNDNNAHCNATKEGDSLLRAVYLEEIIAGKYFNFRAVLMYKLIYRN